MKVTRIIRVSLALALSLLVVAAGDALVGHRSVSASPASSALPLRPLWTYDVKFVCGYQPPFSLYRCLRKRWSPLSRRVPTPPRSISTTISRSQ